jgi:hypothetical protein
VSTVAHGSVSLPQGNHTAEHEETSMSKRARKRRDRKKSGANHGNRPNS